MEDPDKIELDLEQEQYQVGEEAQLQIKAPFAGKALVTVEREKVYDYWIVDLADNTGVVSIPVKEEYKPNAYLSVHLLRSVDGLEDHAPARAFGTIPLMVDNSKARLGIDLDGRPPKSAPTRRWTIKVQVENAGPGTDLTLAAVDRRHLSADRLFAPDPFNFFYGKRRLSLTSHDLYGLLLPGGRGHDDAEHPGGRPGFLRQGAEAKLKSGFPPPGETGVPVVGDRHARSKAVKQWSNLRSRSSMGPCV